MFVVEELVAVVVCLAISDSWWLVEWGAQSGDAAYINIKVRISPHINWALSPALDIRDLPYSDSMHSRFISRHEANTRAESRWMFMVSLAACWSFRAGAQWLLHSTNHWFSDITI